MSRHVVRSRKELLEMLSAGWEIAQSQTMDGGWIVQRGGIGRGDIAFTGASNVAFRLRDAGLLKADESRRFPTQVYEYMP